MVLPLLLAAGCSREPAIPLIGAARDGNTAEIRRLLRAGADANQRGGVNGWPALTHAVHKGQHSAARVLLEGGADPNQRDRRGHTALMMASGYRDTRMVRLLLEGGADPAVEANDGTSALTLAMGGHGQCEVVRLLLKAAPDLQSRDDLWGRLARRIVIRTGCAS